MSKPEETPAAAPSPEPIYYTESGTLVRRLLTQKDYDLLVERHVELKNKYELLASDIAMLANENSELVKKLDAYKASR